MEDTSYIATLLMPLSQSDAASACAAHAHFHRLQYSGEGIVGTEKGLVVAGTRYDDVVLCNLRNISGSY